MINNTNLIGYIVKVNTNNNRDEYYAYIYLVYQAYVYLCDSDGNNTFDYFYNNRITFISLDKQLEIYNRDFKKLFPIPPHLINKV